ncbi:MAG: aspartate carbamoyltransferase catalytic subunit [Pseudomonadota bacterium]
MSEIAGWEGILDKDEQILWQGRPDAQVRLRASKLVGVVFGLFFAGFALFWMIMASFAGGFFWMFGLLHFFVGLGVAAGSLYGSSWRRKYSWYTLTDRRAFIATDMPFSGRSLKSYPITRDTVLDFDGGDPATIHFNHEMRRRKNGSYKVAVGFERIQDGAEVYRLMRGIQERLAS